jgi:ADP-heptose:LPS heptosyltransferase
VSVPNLHWVNLQYDARPSELSRWRQLAGSRFHNWPNIDKKHDLENCAALACELDLVITVVNSTAHLAGAVGTPTWMLVPVGGEWRWQSRGRKCLWHDSIRLFRQRRVDDWSDVFRELRGELTSWVHASLVGRGERAA